MSTTEKKMSPIQNMALELLEQTKIVTKELEKEYEQFLIEKKKFEDEQEALSEKFKIKETVIELNVGGTFFTTLKSTLLRAEGKKKSKLTKKKEQCSAPCSLEGFPLQKINKKLDMTLVQKIFKEDISWTDLQNLLQKFLTFSEQETK
jgi:predicted methyltransferase